MDNGIRNEKHSETGRDERYGRKSLYAIRKRHIEHVLYMTKGDTESAAKALGISIGELYRWMKKLEIRECKNSLKMRSGQAQAAEPAVGTE